MRTALLAVLLAVPVQAAEPLQVPDVGCNETWCMIRKTTLATLLEGAQKLSEHNQRVEALCGWRK